MNRYDEIVTGSLSIAQSECLKRKNGQLSALHLIWGLITNPGSFSSKKLQFLKNSIESELHKLPTLKKVELDQLRPDSKLSEWLTLASSHATQRGAMELGEKDLLRHLPEIFPNWDIPYEEFKTDQDELEVPAFLLNLNELAKVQKLDPVIGRTKEIRAVIEILGRRTKNNPVLVGPAGVGKTAIVEGLADAIVKGQVPDVLKDKVVYSLEMGALMAGTKFRGEFEERIMALIHFVRQKAGEIILFIDEIHQLVGAGRTEGAMDAANLLKPALARGELHCIGATTPQEYQKYILGDTALERRFRDVRVDAPSIEDAIEIMLGLREKLEIHHGIKISDDSLYSAVKLSEQYITHRNLPDKAIDLVDEAAAAMKLEAQSLPSDLADLQSEIRSKRILAQVEKDNKSILEEIDLMQSDFDKRKKEFEMKVLSMKEMTNLKNDLEKAQFELEQAQRNQDYEWASRLKYSVIPDIQSRLGQQHTEWELKTYDIAKVISRQTGIPLEKILKSKQDHILELQEFLNHHIFGQSEALNEIAQTLVAAHAGLTDETRPLGSFLLKGPSGVGKTETAKQLAQFLFNSQKHLVRFDLSEYSEKHSVAKLIGAPAGYVGHDDGGVLTEAIRRNPYAVVLFDELEKAHPDFSHILLQILDDGRLSDNKGRVIDFKNTIILLTTNSENVENEFRPEVLGRLDAILEFKHLNKEIMNSLVHKELKLLNKRLSSREMKIELNEETIAQLMIRGFDERYGARPLNAVFRKYVTRPLSHILLKENLTPGIYQFIWDENRPSLLSLD